MQTNKPGKKTPIKKETVVDKASIAPVVPSTGEDASPTKRKVGRPAGTPRTGGRKKGSVNVLTVTVKQQLEDVFEKMGGVEGLLRWAKKDPANAEVFYSRMWIRLLPKDIKAEINATLSNKTFTPEQMKNMAKAFLEQGD